MTTSSELKQLGLEEHAMIAQLTILVSTNDNRDDGVVGAVRTQHLLCSHAPCAALVAGLVTTGIKLQVK